MQSDEKPRTLGEFRKTRDNADKHSKEKGISVKLKEIELSDRKHERTVFAILFCVTLVIYCIFVYFTKKYDNLIGFLVPSILGYLVGLKRR